MRGDPKENGMKGKIVYKINLPKLGNLGKWSLLKRGKKNADWLGQPYYHSYPFDFYSFQFHINMIKFIQFVIEVGSIFASTGERKIEIDTYQRTLNHI